jgi:hypothetical protein
LIIRGLTLGDGGRWQVLLKLLSLASSLRPKEVLSRVLLNLCSSARLRNAILPVLVHISGDNHRAARRALARLQVPADAGESKGEGEECTCAGGVAATEDDDSGDFPPRNLLAFLTDQSSLGAASGSAESGPPAPAARQILEVLLGLCQALAKVRF